MPHEADDKSNIPPFSLQADVPRLPANPWKFLDDTRGKGVEDPSLNRPSDHCHGAGGKWNNSLSPPADERGAFASPLFPRRHDTRNKGYQVAFLSERRNRQHELHDNPNTPHA